MMVKVFNRVVGVHGVVPMSVDYVLSSSICCICPWISFMLDPVATAAAASAAAATAAAVGAALVLCCVVSLAN